MPIKNIVTGQPVTKEKLQRAKELRREMTPAEKILWEAPNKSQQVFFIKLLGSDVNLGNIPVNEVIPLETLRVGLRGDTMKFFLDQQAS